ncbi:MAG TPA: HAD-IC family P-type ATPase [Actinocrinis sp.]|nr:HAD-IC family P-type ATPase [Actinocrinis sp.]
MGTRGSAFELLTGEGADPNRPGPDPAGPADQRSRARSLAGLPRLRLLRELQTGARGLAEADADARLLSYGENRLSQTAPPGRWRRGRTALTDPFVLLLAVIAAVAALTGSPVGALVVFAGAMISCALRIQQERRGERAAAALRAMVSSTATVVRRAGPDAGPVDREIPVSGLVPGDVVRLVPGDLVPADLYLLAAADLEIGEWVLTGESRPAAKTAAPALLRPDAPRPGDPAPGHGKPATAAAARTDSRTGLVSAQLPAPTVPQPRTPESAPPETAAPPGSVPWLCLAGGTVAHGTGTGVVVATGAATVFGAAHAATAAKRAANGFDRAARRVTWLLLAFTAGTVPLVLTIAANRDLPAPALAFALAVAVGLTPEMLPVVITTVLARAARLMAAEGTVVRRLPAVHDLAAMDTLCVDKTGTLTEGRLAVSSSVDAAGLPSAAALDWAATISRAVTARAPGLVDAFDEALTEAEGDDRLYADLAAADTPDLLTGVFPAAATSARAVAPAGFAGPAAVQAGPALASVIPLSSAAGYTGGSVTSAVFDFDRDLDLDADTGSDTDHESGDEPPAARLASVLPFAVPDHAGAPSRSAAASAEPDADFQILDVLPFDPVRRRVSALLRNPGRLGSVVLVTRGAVAEVLDACAYAQAGALADPDDGPPPGLGAGPGPVPAGPRVTLTPAGRARLLGYAEARAALGDRLIAVATGELAPRRAHTPLSAQDERGLTLVGFVAVRDRAAAGAADAVADLAALGIRVAVLTGDSPEAAERVCREIGLDPGRIVTGARVDGCDDAALAALAARTTVFARVDPAHKARLVAAMRAGGGVVGYLGDGVNDAPALRAADVGIAVRGGAELARECADVVLGDKDLACLGRAVADSRRAVSNAVKYLRITISSNLGNALSVSLAVLILPFLPMLPLQVLVQNLCFDLCQLALARDRVDPGSARRPSRLTARDPARFALVFGLLNTVADLATFVVLHRLSGGSAGPAGRTAHAAFYAGWFAENLLTQALAIFLLRTRRQSWTSRPARAVAAAGLLLAVLGPVLPASGAGSLLAFASPPPAFYPYLGVIAAGYVAAVAAAKAGCRGLWPA